MRKCISLAVIKRALSEQRTPSVGKIITGQIVFATLSTCYFISQMKKINNNNNAGSGVWNQHTIDDCKNVDFYKYPWSLYVESDFLENFWAQRKSGNWLIQYTMIDDKVPSRQSIGYWGKSCWISVNKNNIKRREYFHWEWKLSWDFSINDCATTAELHKLNECVRSAVIYTFGLI